jgi:hypothetical protein
MRFPRVVVIDDLYAGSRALRGPNADVGVPAVRPWAYACVTCRTTHALPSGADMGLGLEDHPVSVHHRECRLETKEACHA